MLAATVSRLASGVISFVSGSWWHLSSIARAWYGCSTLVDSDALVWAGSDDGGGGDDVTLMHLRADFAVLDAHFLNGRRDSRMSMSRFRVGI